jgi:biopolymer transport protein ExbD
MLIFFIVTATFLNEKGLEINKPDNTSEKSPPSSDDDRAIVINIDARGRISIDDREIDVDAVRANIVRMKAERPKAALVVRPDEDAETNVMVQVMDQAYAARVGPVTVSPPQ